MDAIYEFLTLQISSIEFRKQLIEDEKLLKRIADKIPRSTFAQDPVWKDSPMLHTTILISKRHLRQVTTVLESCGAHVMDIN